MKKILVLFPILVLLIVSCQNKEDQAALDDMKAKEEFEGQNRALVEKFIQNWNTMSIQVLEEHLDPQFKVYIPSNTGEPMSLAQWKEWIQRISQSFPDIQYEIMDMMVENDKVCVRWTCTATFQSDPDDPATKKEISGSGIEIYTVENGKIIEERSETNSLGWNQQLGL
jgi:predicted ester cyclase